MNEKKQLEKRLMKMMFLTDSDREALIKEYEENPKNIDHKIKEKEDNAIQSLIDDLNSHLKPSKDYEAFNVLREMWNREDDLLNSRTNSFLSVNAIIFAAAQLKMLVQSPTPYISFFSIMIAFVGLIITIYWRLISGYTYYYIDFYSSLGERISPEFFKRVCNFKKFRLPLLRNLYANKIIVKRLPGIILISWVVYITVSLIELIKH